MVKSFIYPDKIQYNEIKEINNDDVGHASTIYEIEYFDKPIQIALGRENHSYSNDNIVYFSVYLVSNDKIHSRIGVFEVDSNKMISIIDEDGDIDIEQGHILLFVDQQYIFENTSPLLSLSSTNFTFTFDYSSWYAGRRYAFASHHIQK